MKSNEILRLSLQDMMDRKGLKVIIDVQAANDSCVGSDGRKSR